jgi:hypothetical protein
MNPSPISFSSSSEPSSIYCNRDRGDHLRAVYSGVGASVRSRRLLKFDPAKRMGPIDESSLGMKNGIAYLEVSKNVGGNHGYT